MIKELIVGESYTLRHTKSFCHTLGVNGFKDFTKDMNSGDTLNECIFVGVINIDTLGERQIFYRPSSKKRTYIMFGNDNLKHIVK